MVMKQSAADKRSDSRRTLRLYLDACLKTGRPFWLTILLPIGAVILNVSAPFYASKILAGVLTHKADVNHYFILFILSLLVGLILNFVAIRNAMRLQARVMNRLHDEMFTKLMKRSVSFYTNRVSGKLVSDALDYSRGFSQLHNALYIQGFVLLANAIVGLIIIFFNSWALGLLVTVVLGGLTIWTLHESRLRSGMRAERLKLTKLLTSHLSDSLVNAVTVKTFAAESFEDTQSQKYSRDLAHAQEKDWTRTVGNENYRIAILYLLQGLLIFAFIKISDKDGQLIATSIFAFTYTITLLNRFFNINTIVRQIEETLLQATPMTEMMLQPIEIPDAKHASELSVTKGSIKFTAVSFSYTDSDSPTKVFNDLDLNIQAGEHVGLVGASGGGKTTLTKLLLRFDDIQSGTIAIDGIDIKSVTQSSLRRSIAYVPQEPLLFHRSVKENIAYGRPDSTNADIVAAARSASADLFIRELPNGYDTVVGERGVKLSGGQRQRVAIARAMLKAAPILVLDEATSALDSESEILIQDALWKLMENRTAVVIAHRLSTIQRMHRIVVLQHGTIVEQGSHKQLLGENGVYAKLWAHQSGGFMED
jgi:ATP-binding cassette subfamily B protein